MTFKNKREKSLCEADVKKYKLLPGMKTKETTKPTDGDIEEEETLFFT